MTRSPDSLPALRDHAVGGLEHLGELLELAAGLGAAVAGTEAMQRPFRQVGGVDPALMAAEGRRLSAAHRSVAERLPHDIIVVGDVWVAFGLPQPTPTSYTNTPSNPITPTRSGR